MCVELGSYALNWIEKPFPKLRLYFFGQAFELRREDADVMIDHENSSGWACFGAMLL